MRSQRLAVATNFLPYQAVGLISFLQTAVAANFFCYQAIRCCAFPLVGNAHRAFRGGKHGRMPFGRATENIQFTEQKHNVNFNPCIVRPSNAQNIILFTFTVYNIKDAVFKAKRRPRFFP